MAGTRLTRSYGAGVTGNRSKWTFSGWIKRSNEFGSEQGILTVYSNSSYYTSIDITSEDQINFFDLYNGGINGRVRANARNRDCTGWTHIVCTFDRNNATSGDKIRMWINGVRITGALASLETMPANATTLNSDSQTLEIGAKNNASYFNGQMSHLHFCDGYAYEASDFGGFDSTTGEWSINTSPSVTYGTQGWFILKDGNSVTDESTNTNNFTVSNGTLTKTEDNPSNVFATIDRHNECTASGFFLEYGNTRTTTSDGGQFGGSSNLGAKTGKYYFEIKFTSGTTTWGNINFVSSSNARETARQNVHANQLSASFPSFCYEFDGNVYKDSTSTVANYGSYAVGDIIMIAADLDNQYCYFGRNGTWGNSSDPTSGATGTGGASMSANPDFWHLALGDRNSSGYNVYDINFGNGYFGTTAVASAGTNASGNGIFEYDVPTGYTALSTKGLNL